MTDLMTQAQELHEYLLNHEAITPLEALRDLGIMRLASRISDLKKQGVPIKKEMVKVKARNGRTTCVARYSIIGEEI